MSGFSRTVIVVRPKADTTNVETVPKDNVIGCRLVATRGRGQPQKNTDRPPWNWVRFDSRAGLASTWLPSISPSLRKWK